MKINDNNQTLDNLSANCNELIEFQQTLMLSTASVQGIPNISYAPYVRDHAGCFYIYVSDLAMHTANLLDNPQASIMFIRAETDSSNMFARARVIFNCNVFEIKQIDDAYSQQIDVLTEKFGDVVSLLRSLPDFHLFALKPFSGQYVVGFGQAYKINVDDHTLSHISA